MAFVSGSIEMAVVSGSIEMADKRTTLGVSYRVQRAVLGFWSLSIQACLGIAEEFC